MNTKSYLYFLFFVLIASCNSTATITEANDPFIENEKPTTFITLKRMHFIDSYTSKIDFKANDSDKFNINELKMQGDKRIITTNESDKNIVLKNKSIVMVKYKDHLYNNFIKSKAFYYDNNELVCIKVYEILPNEFNKAALYKRTIYIQDNKAISDSDESNQINKSHDLVVLGHKYLKNEYLSLN